MQAALGPSARGCCYEVGEEVHAHFEGYDARVGERNLDLAKVARAQLEAAGVAEVHDVGLCTMCAIRSCSSPTAATAASRAARRGHVAGMITGIEVETVRAATERVREEIAAAARKAGRDPADVELLAAVKYIALEELGALAEAGLTLHRREPRAGARGQGGARTRSALALHRPAPEPQGQADPAVRGADPLGRLGLRAAPARAPRHAGDRILVEVNVAGEEGKAGVAPEELPALPRARPGHRRRA